MNRVLVDTSAYSAFMRGHEEVRAALGRADQITLNPVVLGELRSGFLRGARRRANEQELRSFRLSPRVTTIDLDDETSDRYALILDALRNAGTPIPTNDIWIAASAMQHGLRLLTTDAHYRNVGQVVVDYIDPT